MSRFAKTLGFQVIANDWEPYAREINLAYVGCNRVPTYDKLLGGDATTVFDHLNALPPIEGYVARHLCPRDDLTFDSNVERLFFTRANGGRIDAIRARIGEWEREGRLTDAERAYILASLLYAVSYVSNTSGVFKGFHRGWGGATGTALYRIQSSLRLSPPILFDNGRDNRITALDAQSLAEQLAEGERGGDIAYLDPPYNQHRYFTNYHIWETLVAWDLPEHYGVACKRTDARDDATKSVFNSKRTMPQALAKVVNDIDCRLMIISYNDESWIALDQLEAMCEKFEAVTSLAFDSRRYVGAQIGIHNPNGEKVGKVSHLNNHEYLVVAGDYSDVANMAAAVTDDVRAAISG